MAEQRLIIENQEQSVAQISDTTTGTCAEYLVRRDNILLNPTTGERVFQTTAEFQRARDGRLATAEMLLVCRDCGKGCYTLQAAAGCVDCGQVIGRHCCVKDQSLPLCKHCRRARFWRAIKFWLMTLGG